MLSRIALFGLVVAGCVPPTPVAEQTMPEPVQVAGPPGGEMDQPMDPAAYGDPPADDAEATQDVSDPEIDVALEGFGQWENDPDAGEVWRPDATLVGADFTPYDSGGSWVYTEDYGWTFGCDYSWGWLPFHYGRWGWFHDHWGWVRGHNWGPAWVDWRHGGGVVGWRPMAPEVHGKTWGVPESHWHFVNETNMGNGHIRGKELALGQGMGVTQPVARPSFRGQVSVRPSTVMGTRPRPSSGGGYRAPNPTYGSRTPYRPYTQQPYTGRQPAVRQPTYTQPNYSRPPTYSRPTYNPQVQRPTYRPQPTYTRPQPTYTPRPTYTQPSRPTYSPPPRPTYSPPAQTHSSPPASHSSSSPPASHSSSSSTSSSSSSSSHHR